MFASSFKDTEMLVMAADCQPNNPNIFSLFLTLPFHKYGNHLMSWNHEMHNCMNGKKVADVGKAVPFDAFKPNAREYRYSYI